MNSNLIRSIFKGKMPKPDTTNPYLNARRTWNIYVGNFMSFGVIGIIGGLICLLIALAAVGGVIYIGSQSKFVPLVFQQDSTGNTISMTRADRIPPAKVDDYRSAVAEFISNLRLVTPDAQLQTKAVWRAYAFLSPNDPATTKANEYLSPQSSTYPFSRAANETVSIDIRSVLQQSRDTWQIDWIETVRSRDGMMKTKPSVMRALVTIYQNPDADMQSRQMFTNPHFVFIKDFDWSQQVNQGQTQ